jgi:hypothetical protein
MATAENITPRRVLQDLGYAPRLNAPEAIMQPAPQAPLPARDTETTQLVNALGEVNKQIAAYSDIYTNQREQADMQDAAANSIKLLDEAKANQTKTGQAIQSYIDANAANYGSSPKVRKYLYTSIGERQAAEGYTKLLDQNRTRVANSLKPENADDVIAETRQKFLAQLGDNMFSRAGAESVMNQADNSFRNYAQAQQDEFVKQEVLTNFDVKMRSMAKEGSLLDSPNVTAENLLKAKDDLKAAGVHNADDIWRKTLQSVLITESVGGHGDNVRKIAEYLKSKEITTTDAKGVTTVLGKLGEGATMSSFFETLDGAILKASTEKATADHYAVQVQNQADEDKTTEAVYGIIGKYGNDATDPKAKADIEAAIKIMSPTSAALARNTETAAKLVANFNNSVSATTPQAVESYLKAVDSNDFATADSIYNTFSLQDRNKFHATHQGFLTSARELNSPAIVASVEQVKSNLTAALKAVTTEPDFATKFDVINRSLSQYKAQISKEIKDDRKNWKDLSPEDIAFRVGDITARVGQEIVQKSTGTYEAFKNSPQGQREASSAPARPLPKGTKRVSSSKNYNDLEQIDAVNAWVPTYKNIQETSNLSFNFTDPKSQALASQTQESIKYIADSMMPNLVSMSRYGKNQAGETVSPQTQESATSAYLSLKSVVGYTPQEVLTGKTSDGVPIDFEATLATNPNFSYTTKFFANQQEFTKAVNEYATLANQLSTATTDVQKQELQFKLKNTQYYQLTNKLLPRSGVASLDAASIEKFNNNQKTMLPYGTMTQSDKQVQAGTQTIGQQSDTNNIQSVRRFPSSINDVKKLFGEVTQPAKAIYDFYGFRPSDYPKPASTSLSETLGNVVVAAMRRNISGGNTELQLNANKIAELQDALTQQVQNKTGDTAKVQQELNILNARQAWLKLGPAAQQTTPEPTSLAVFSKTGMQSIAPYGLREDNTAKGTGYFGQIKLKSGGVSSEYSIGINLNGKETLVPSLVPTLDAGEYSLMVNDIIPNNKPVPNFIVKKAAEFAKQRIADGKSPFIQKGESISKVPTLSTNVTQVPQKPTQTYAELHSLFDKKQGYKWASDKKFKELKSLNTADLENQINTYKATIEYYKLNEPKNIYRISNMEYQLKTLEALLVK